VFDEEKVYVEREEAFENIYSFADSEKGEKKANKKKKKKKWYNFFAAFIYLKFMPFTH